MQIDACHTPCRVSPLVGWVGTRAAGTTLPAELTGKMVRGHTPSACQGLSPLTAQKRNGKDGAI